MASGLLDKANIILTPTGYKAGTMYNVAPIEQPYEDFVFARASVASRVNSSGLVEMVGRTIGSNLVQNGDFSEIGTDLVQNGDFSEIGPDLVQNGTFDLGPELMPSVASIVNLGGGSITQISSNSYSSTSDGTSGSSVRPKFDFNTTSGKTYKLVITPTGTITGTVNFDFYDGSSYLFNNYDFTTTKEICFRDNGIVFGAFDGNQTYSVDSFTISVKEVPDWTLSSESNIINGELVIDALDGSFQYAQQDFNTIVGKTYKVQFDITEINDVGEIQLLYGALLIGLPQYTSVGTHTLYFTSISSSDTFTIKRKFPSSTKVTIDNVSVKEVPDWTLGTGWSVQDNKAYFDNSTGTEITQSLSTTSNSYKINFDLDLQNGSCRVYFNSPGISTQITLNSSGNKTAYITTTTNHTKFTIAGTGGSEFNITNIVVQELDPNDYWNLGTGWSIGDDEATSDGVSGNSNLYQENILTVGKTYKVSVDVTRNSGEVRFYITSDPTATITSSGTFIFYGVCDRTDLDFHIKSVYFDGSITNVVVQEIIDTNNIPRINYDSNGENGHWLLEPTSTNILPYSEDFTKWTLDDVTVINNATTSPNGDTSASLIIGNTNASRHNVVKTGLTNTITASYSLFAKAKELRYLQIASVNTTSQVANFDLLNGTIGTVGAGFSDVVLEEYPNDWYKISLVSLNRYNSFYISLVSSTTASWLESWAMPNSTDGLYIWGAQLEELSHPTSYIPTLTGSSETRATETSNGAGSADLINSTEGVLYAEIAALADDLTRRIITITDGTLNNIVKLEYKNTSNQIEAVLYNGNTECLILHTLTDETQFNKIAFKYKQDDFSLFVNGIKVGTDTSGAVFTPNTLNNLSFYQGNANNLFGKLKELAVFGEALSDDELEKLTSWSSFNAMATDLGYTIE